VGLLSQKYTAEWELPMRKTGAVILAIVGLLLAVGIPITIAVAFNIDPGKQPGILVGGMTPGIVVMALASKLWKGGTAVKPTPDQIPLGYLVCDLCGQAVPEAEVEAQGLNPRTPMARVGFVCDACDSYRTRRAYLALFLFLASLIIIGLVAYFTIPRPLKH
jgi:hypothetical protein